MEHLSEVSTLISSSSSEETKSQPNLQCWHNPNAPAAIRKENNAYVPDPCAVGKVSEIIQYYELPGCGDVFSQRRVASQDVDFPGGAAARSGQRDAGVPPLNLPTSPGTDGDGSGPAKCRLGPHEAKHGADDDFVKHFLDVKLMEASMICQEMKRDAPRPGGEHGKVVLDPETSVLYSIQQSRWVDAFNESVCIIHVLEILGTYFKPLKICIVFF